MVENPLYIWGNDGLGVAIGFTIEQRGNCEEQRDHYNAGHCSGQNDLRVCIQRNVRKNRFGKQCDRDEQRKIDKPPAIRFPWTAEEDFFVGVDDHIIGTV